MTQKKTYGAHVKLSDEEYQKLCETFTQPTVDKMIENMNDYLAAHGKQPYKDFAAALRIWIKKDLAEGKTSTASSAAANERLAKKIQAKNPKNKHIVVGYNYIEFILGPMSCNRVNFDDNGFNEQVNNNLRKMGLK